MGFTGREAARNVLLSDRANLGLANARRTLPTGMRSVCCKVLSRDNVFQDLI